ncbi:uncharacterized protein LOC129960383 [Argiope bruennichi]|uniref:uncharacterized protein LOC129960383 n=1 Tax=Argiope bruennichi TaxID=94029 RepID=UPI0024950971|nr:uncharacterized protein LOC129960383 [Argiope bruennichi]
MLFKGTKKEYVRKHYVKTHTRTDSGRYVVKMPMREKSNSQLGESKDIALRRLNWLYKRLKKEPIMWELYKIFIDEYQSLGHMSEVIDCEEPDITYCIPHEGVYRPQNNSTPLRVVFNASQATTTGYSLNSLLLNGGIVQEELFSNLCRFRTHRFAFIADVKKMYRQILVEESQQDLLRILWKNSDDDPIKITAENLDIWHKLRAIFSNTNLETIDH